MKFELLPNEIIIECFEFLNAFDIFYSFDRLNYRLYKLIGNIRLHLDFQYVRKSVFDQFWVEMLLNPEMKRQIYSLNLSGKGICVKIKAFRSFFTLAEFSNVRSLTITETGDINITELKEMLISMMPQLCYFRWFHENEYTIYGAPISYQDILSVSDLYSINETLLITDLTLHECSYDDLYGLLQHTPMLKYLNIQCFDKRRSNSISTYSKTRCVIHLKQMIIGDSGRCSFKEFEMLIRQAPNLKSLTIFSTNQIDMADASAWEHLITSSLPYLDIFKFKFGSSMDKYDGDDIEFVDYLKQFQTDFWQVQHHWYTEYVIEGRKAFIYTIPYASNIYEIRPNTTRYSNNLIHSVNTLHNVTDLSLHKEVLTENCQYYFSNVVSLNIISCHWSRARLFYLTTKYLKSTVNLFNLKHLSIASQCKMESSLALLEILKATPHLSSLSISANHYKSVINDKELCKYLNEIIKRAQTPSKTKIQ